MPPELSAALTAVTLAVALFLGVVIKRQLRNNGKSSPPASSSVTDTGSYVTIPAMIGEQMEIHVKPITQRLERIERNQERCQEMQSKRLGFLETAVARIDERTRTP